MARSIPKPLIAAIVVGAVGIGIWQWQARTEAARDSSQITANGTIEADEVAIGAQRAARLVQYRVQESQTVKKGDIIAVLDTSELAAQLEQAKGNVALSLAKLSELERGTRREELDRAAAELLVAKAGTRGAERTVANARKSFTRRTTLKQALDAATTQHNQAQAAVQQAESALAGAEEAVKTAEREQSTSVTLRQARDAAKHSLEGAQAQERNAEARLRELVNGARPEELDAARATLAQAVATLKQMKEDAQNADTELKRTKELFAGNAASDKDLAAAQTRYDTARARVQQADQARVQASARLAEMVNGTRKEQLDAARAALEQAKSGVEGGRKTLENAQEALELKLSATASLDAARTQRNVASAQVASARAALSGAELAVRNARTAYEDALGEKQGLDTAQTQYESGLAQMRVAEAKLNELRNGATPEEKEQVRSQLRQARGALELAKVQYEQSVIRAPQDGVITEHVARVGEVVNPGATVARLVPLDEVHLTLYVPLPELGKVKLGQFVDITADTYPGRHYRGKVSQISDTPEFTPRNVQTQDERVKLVFQAKVTIDNAKRELKPGMPADAKIKLK
jgi:multidrug resistance efflux pump